MRVCFQVLQKRVGNSAYPDTQGYIPVFANQRFEKESLVATIGQLEL